MTQCIPIRDLKNTAEISEMCRKSNSPITITKNEGRLIRNIVLFSVLVYELIGPTLTKWALTKAGDIQPKSHEVVNRRQMKTIKAIEEREVHKNS